jgi:mono/diheme cytochrome c family protein
MPQSRSVWRTLPAVVGCGLAAACASSVSVESEPVGGPLGLSPPFEGADASFGFGPDGGSPIQPTFGATVTASTPPPPISGGTLIVSNDGTLAIAADSDRDAVYVVNLGTQSVKTVALQAGDEPGRLIEDGAGLVHVALRGAGAIVTIDPVAGTVTGRQSVCPAPRGVAWDSSTDLVWVACATGELVALPSKGGSAVSSFVVERDLRDVLVSGGSVSVTQFRSAQVLRIASDGSIARSDALPNATGGFSPHVVWRAVPGPAGTLAAVHQEESLSNVTTQVQGGYGGCGGGFSGLIGVADAGISPPISEPIPPPLVSDDGGLEDAVAPAADAGVAFVDAAVGAGVDAGTGLGAFGCATVSATVSLLPLGAGSDPVSLSCFLGGIVRSDLTLMGPDGSVLFNAPLAGALPVDVAVSADGSLVAVATPGNTLGPQLSTVFEFGVCDQSVKLATTLGPAGAAEPIAVAFDASNDLLVQTREPAQLWILGGSSGPTSVTLSSTTRADTGHEIFHVQAGGMIACASCHPEGGDDGNIWTLDGNSRRTPSLRGTIAGTAPYHWPGDMNNMTTLIDNVYTVRMSGAALATDQIAVLTNWVESVPAPPAPSWVDSAAATRGKAIFTGAAAGCSTCHSGPKFTNNMTLDVGTGGLFQVPPLVGLGWRAPFLHNGCAATLADRFGSCSTPTHGNITSLTAGNISDLEAYLETL